MNVKQSYESNENINVKERMGASKAMATMSES